MFTWCSFDQIVQESLVFYIIQQLECSCLTPTTSYFPVYNCLHVDRVLVYFHPILIGIKCFNFINLASRFVIFKLKDYLIVILLVRLSVDPSCMYSHFCFCNYFLHFSNVSIRFKNFPFNLLHLFTFNKFSISIIRITKLLLT